MDKRGFSSRSLGLDRSVALGLGAALAFFLVSGVLGYMNLAALVEGNQRIIQTHRAILSLNQMLSMIQDAETGQRGFLLTNEDSYLEPYDAAVTAIPGKLEEIQALVGADQKAVIAQIQVSVRAKLEELQQTIEVRRNQGLDAALAIVRSSRGKAEMDAIRAQLTAVSDAETTIRMQRLAEMDRSQRTAVLSTVFASLAGMVLAGIVGFLMRRETLSRRRMQWLQAGQVGLANALLGDKHADELADSALDFLARYTGAIAGALFVGDRDGFRRASVYGVPAAADVPEAFHFREGLLGQAAAENKSIFVTDVPPGYLSYGSALGRATPANLAIVPGAVDEAVNSVVELGFVRKTDKVVMDLVEDSSDAIAVAVRAALFRGKLQELLEETQRQSEELQAQSEELRVSNEELEEQGRALKESQSRLEQQQEELEQTNAQLEEQASALETQRDALERTNAAVEAKAQELEQASQYKSDFLANMSHELRTPLNSSLILAKLLAENPDDNLTPEQVKFAQTIESSGKDLLNLINDILDLSKIEAGHVEIHPQPSPVERVTNGLRQLFQPVAEQKQLAFNIDISPDAPAMVETDPQRLEQVLKNLLSNAFKFTEQGSVTLAIAPVGNDALQFSVTDTGIGIAQDQQRKVFEAFHQADSTISRRFGGTGLGLSISRQLVRLLGGSIDLRSQPGQGTTFEVRIPMVFSAPLPEVRRVVDAPEAVPAEPLLQSTTAPPAPALSRPAPAVADDRRDLGGSNRVLLIVEDDAVFAGILRDMAHELQFRTLVAGTATEALELAREFLPNAVVLDIGLPDQSGLSVLDRLKGDVRTRHIPVHVVSAGDEAAAAISLGAVGHALKPVQKEQLFEVLRKLEDKFTDKVNRVLIVEDDPVQREAMSKLLGSRDVVTVAVGTAQECLDQLKHSTFDCMVLDLSLPDASGYALLETLSSGAEYAFPPVIVYTGRELSADDEMRLRRYSKSIIIKGAKSPERLLDEVSLFLHQVVADLPDEQQRMIRKARSRDALLEGRRILIVEDDVRNVYALTNILEPRGAVTQIARNGREALDALEKGGSPIDLVLMDVMMPVMDGLEATRAIRKNARFRKLPIIALTAKAMPDDQQRCIEAGANDYMAKPLDVERLLSLVRVWMPK